jgi:hypothetical protein
VQGVRYDMAYVLNARAKVRDHTAVGLTRLPSQFEQADDELVGRRSGDGATGCEHAAWDHARVAAVGARRCVGPGALALAADGGAGALGSGWRTAMRLSASTPERCHSMRVRTAKL